MSLRNALVGGSLLAVLALVAIGLRAGNAGAKDAWDLASRVPASTVAYVAIEDVASLDDQFAQTSLGEFLDEPEMKAFLAPVIERIKRFRDELTSDGRESGMPPELVSVLEHVLTLKGQLSIALLALAPDGGPPSFVASFDAQGDLDDFVESMEQLRASVDPSGERVASEAREGRTWWALDSGGLSMAATTFGATFLVGSSVEAVKHVIDAPPSDSLALSEIYTKTLARMGTDARSLVLFANAESLVAAGGEPAQVAARIFGGEALRGLAYGMSFVERGFRDSFVVYVPNATGGLFSLIQARPYRGETVALAPKNAVYFSEGCIVLSDVVARIRAFNDELDPEANRAVERFVDRLRRHLDINIEDEVLSQLEGGLASYVAMPATGGLYPEVVIMVKVKDAQTAAPRMMRLAGAIAGALNEEGEVLANVESRTFRGKQLHLVKLQAAKGDDLVPLTPTWSFIGDWMVLSLVPHTMKELILRHEAKGESLAANTEFQRLVKSRPAHTSFVTYYDTAAMMRMLYDTAVPLLQAAGKPNMLPRDFPMLDFTKLPAARVVNKYFDGTMTFTTIDGKGLAVSVQGPMPMIMSQYTFLLAVAVGMNVVRALPLGDQKDELARTQLFAFRNAVSMYKLMNKRLPTSLDDLTKPDADGERFLGDDRIPLDPWGRPYMYLATDRAFSIASAGPDGKFGTEDDIAYPTESRTK